MSWLLNLAYFAVLLAASPILLWRMIVRGKYRAGWPEKLFGQVPPRKGHGASIWFHAVSVGEVLQLEPVLSALRARLPGIEFIITSTTSTGLAVARARFPNDHVCYFPLDFSWSVRRALRRLRPTAIVLVELELWPNLVRLAALEGIPLALINARVSERSYRGYLRLGAFFGSLLRSIHTIAVQDATYESRLLKLGARRDRVYVTGSIKFDQIITNRDNPKTNALRRAFGLLAGEAVWIAGSTQEPEESIALDVYKELLTRFPHLRLIVVPRHKERFESVARLIESRGYPLLRRSQLANSFFPPNSFSPLPAREGPGLGDLNSGSASTGPKPILLLDTLGELAAGWGLADVAFVGGSLGNRGGQNMIEPAGYGAAVLFGPNTQNFRDVVERLLAEKAACVVRDKSELSSAIARLLSNPAERAEMGARAQRLVASQQGATARTVELLLKLPGLPSPSLSATRAA